MSGEADRPPFAVWYHPDVARDDIPRLDRAGADRVRRGIAERLATNPLEYGKPLRATLAGLWSLRIGDYRVVFRIEGREVHVLLIGHRKDVYEHALVARRAAVAGGDRDRRLHPPSRRRDR